MSPLTKATVTMSNLFAELRPSHQVSRSHAIVKKKKVRKKNSYKTSPQGPTQTRMGGKGKGKAGTQFLPSLWAILRSPEGQNLIRAVDSVPICRCYENC